MPSLALAVAVLLWLALPGEAFAYLDPGTGSAVIQMLVAGVMGALFLLKMYWRKLVALFGGKRREETDPAAQPSPSGDERD